MPFNRNVLVYEGGTGRELAGFWQYGRISIATFYVWLEATLIIEDSRALWLFPCDSRENLTPIGGPLNYKSPAIITAGSYVLLDQHRVRLRSAHVLDRPRHRGCILDNPQPTDFATRVHDRDLRCCFTGRPVVGKNLTGFEAVHIFPLNHIDEWNRRNLSRFISDPLVTTQDKINSVQQGFLACSTEHRLFNNYQLGVNPDAGYRITDFGGGDPAFTLDGKTFYVNPDVPEHFRPSDALLREHFSQCILACMKATVRPHDLEYDLVKPDPAATDPQLAREVEFRGPHGERDYLFNTSDITRYCAMQD